MSVIFVCGATEYDDPFAWQDEVAELDICENHVFFNPYEVSPDIDDPYGNPEQIMEPNLSFVEDSADGLLVSWQDNAFLAAAVMYMQKAYEKGIPIVIWYQGSRDTMQIPLSYMATSFHSDRETALRVLLAKLGDTDALTS